MKKDKKILIPHLKLTILVSDLSKLKGLEKKGSCFTTRLENINPEKDRKLGIGIFIENLEETIKIKENFPIIAHEVMHAIQIICEEYGMNIETEKEHTAYLMSYILEEIINPITLK